MKIFLRYTIREAVRGSCLGIIQSFEPRMLDSFIIVAKQTEIPAVCFRITQKLLSRMSYNFFIPLIETSGNDFVKICICYMHY